MLLQTQHRSNKGQASVLSSPPSRVLIDWYQTNGGFAEIVVKQCVKSGHSLDPEVTPRACVVG